MELGLEVEAEVEAALRAGLAPSYLGTEFECGIRIVVHPWPGWFTETCKAHSLPTGEVTFCLSERSQILKRSVYLAPRWGTLKLNSDVAPTHAVTFSNSPFPVRLRPMSPFRLYES